jgi:hypothetical protein
LYLGDGQRLHGEVGRILAGSQSSEQLARAEIIDYDLWLNNRVPIANLRCISTAAAAVVGSHRERHPGMP